MKQVLCVGECMLELAHVDERTLQLGFAGDTYNAAVYLRRVARELDVDVEVGYLTGLGEDAYSSAMRGAWEEEGIRDRSLTVPGRSPGLYAIRTASDGERTFSYWRDQSAARVLLADPVFCRALDGDLIHLSGITLQLTTRESRTALLERLRDLREAGSTISFDTNYRAAGWASPTDAATAMADACATADIVLASEDDERQLHGPDTPDAMLQRLVELGPGEVILRAGEQGALVATDGDSQWIPAVSVARVVDTTAAGDASAGAYLAARLAGQDPLHAAALANRAAAVVIRHRGAVIRPDIPLSVTHEGATPRTARCARSPSARTCPS